MPQWGGRGTEDDPYRIDSWHEFLNCPTDGCGYARALKACSPEQGRNANRKRGKPEVSPIEAARAWFRAQLGKKHHLCGPALGPQPPLREPGRDVATFAHRGDGKPEKSPEVKPGETQRRLNYFIEKFEARVLSRVSYKEE